MLQLRGWQKDAFAQYERQLAAGGKSALWEATPGAGKTTAALRVVKHQLGTGLAKRALVVVPTSHLRIQWARAAARLGLHFDSAFGGERVRLSADYQGAVVTYQQFGNRERVFRELASNAVVILDEVHHAGDGLTWGNAIKASLEPARFVLCLSGTAFRSDNNPIPFVTYDKEGISIPDFTYTYARAVEEGVCRPTAVLTYGGDIAWTEHERVYSANFTDALDRSLSARRLRAALDPEAGWIQPLLKDAHKMLCETRGEHPAAGGLIVCADQTHARQMAKLITEVSDKKPTVVLSDDSGASRRIKQFADDDSFWLVACNMVSEGVDIPRLRVGVYATTIRTRMYFRQFLGRIVRRQAKPAGLQVSYLYLPADPILHSLAEEIEEECRHMLNRPRDSLFDEDRGERKEYVAKEKTWTALQGVNSGVDSVIVQGNQLVLFGHPSTDVRAVVHREVEVQLEERLTRSEEKAKLASEIKMMVGAVHRKTAKPHSAIHTILNKAQGVRSQAHCTEAQLRERVALLHRLMLSDGKRAGLSL